MFLRFAEEVHQQLVISDDDGLSGEETTCEDPGAVLLTHFLHEHWGVGHELNSLVWQEAHLELLRSKSQGDIIAKSERL